MIARHGLPSPWFAGFIFQQANKRKARKHQAIDFLASFSSKQTKKRKEKTAKEKEFLKVKFTKKKDEKLSVCVKFTNK